jgi:uncharacterized protein DUF1918
MTTTETPAVVMVAKFHREAPPYLVRWLAGEYEPTVSPGAGAHVHKGH